MSRFTPVLIIIAIFIVGGCSSIKVLDENGVDQGVRFYTAKPYILVTRTGAKDKPSDVQVVYLPDTEHPQFAKVSFGIGSADLSVKIANGSLSEFGGTGDSKASEFLTALTGGFKTIEEALLLHRTDPDSDSEVEQADQTKVDFARNKIREVVDAMPDTIQLLTDTPTRSDIQTAWTDLVPGLRSVQTILGQTGQGALARINNELPGVLKVLNKVSGQMGKTVAQGGLSINGNTTREVQNYMTALTTRKVAIDAAIAALSDKTDKPIMELYEVIQAGGVTSLRRVILP